VIWLLAGCTFLDTAPPALSATWADAPGPTRGDVRLILDVVDERHGPIEVWLGDERLVSLPTFQDAVVVPAGVLPEGPSTLRVVAIDGSPWANRSDVTVDVLVDTVPPTVVHADPPATAGQGRTMVVWLRSDEPLVEPMLHAFGHDVPLFEMMEGRKGIAWRALVGVPLRTEPGPTTLPFTARDAAGNPVAADVPVVVEAVEYPRGGRIRLTKAQVEARKDDDAKAYMRATRDAAYALHRPRATFHVPMARPVVGRTTSPFGVYRTYSDGGKSFHTGLDLANARGTPVTAAASGEVVMAQEQAIFGNAVIVHHGHGVTTSYNHLDRIDAVVGQGVRAGGPIGLLGSTGQSTGPHLHFSMVVGEEAVDPSQWLDGDLDLLPPPVWSSP
jgi:murein DD-endopeptidase MepM/ murein hydrolase activator NlpD